MTATERLRELLDERGVEHEGGERSLRWRDRYGVMMQAFPLADGELGMEVWSCTPEQAIAATLGIVTCHDASIGRYREYGTRFTCSECGATVVLLDDQNEPTILSDGVGMHPRYCPNCGRKVVSE